MKKLNLFVGVLVIAALLLLIVLFVSTFFTDGDTARPDPTATPPETTATATPPPTDNAVESPIPTEDVQTTPEGTPLQGESISLPAPVGRETLAFIYSPELFSRMSTEMGELFYLISDTTNEAFIEIIFISGDLELRKASFLDAYIPNFTKMDTLGQVLVADSSVAAEGLSATNGVKSADAWLIDVEGGFFAVVTGYSDEASRADLYRMLDTLTFSL